MYLTKPAGVFLQVIGGFVLFGGIITMFFSVLDGIIVSALGLGLLWVGGLPSRQKT